MELIERRRILLNTPHINIVTGLQFVTDMVAPLESLVINFSPIQDLHGYDSPWPAGGGKNLFNINVTRQDPSNTATANTNNRIFTSGTYCVGISASNYYYERNVVDYSISDGVLSVENKNVYGVGFAISLEPGTYNLSYTGAANARAGVGFYSNDGSYISGITSTVRTFTVPDNASMTVIVFYSSTAETATFSNIQLEVGSSATSYSPYSNICPISGWTGANVVACGVNVWDEEWELGSYSNTNGEPTTYTDRIRSKNRFGVLPNTEYFFKTSNGLTAGNAYFYDVNDVFISARTTIGNTAIVTPNNCKYMRIAMGLPYGATYNNDVSINCPSTDHDYHPYVGASVNIDWTDEAGEVYGGSLDVTTGVLTVNRKVVTVSAITTVGAAYIKSDAVDGFVTNSEIYPLVAYNSQPDLFCDKLMQAKANIWEGTGYANCFAINSNQIHINISNDLLGITDYTEEDRTTAKEKLNTWLAENPVTLTIPVAETAYQLTPQQIRTLKGTNNLFSNSNGEVTVNYWTHLD